ncbi:MAG: VanZ family protein [Candidatus Omnitrophica bacterium]|nr:VanZ family protein [Candidatus Omnitrophota bacterium]
MRPLTSRDPSTRPAGRRLKFLKFWFPVFLYSGIIFYASSRPDVKPPLGIKNIDKAIHVLEYLPFGFLLARAFIQQWPAVKIWQVVTICSLLYGISDEYHQGFVPGRESSVMDAVADTIGGFLGVWIYLFRQKRVTSKQKAG